MSIVPGSSATRIGFRVGFALLVLVVALAAWPAWAVVPGPVQNVGWCSGAKDCLQWSSTVGASQYRIYRGERASLPCLLNPPIDSCLVAIVVQATTGSGAIPEIPAPGSFYWFIVTAESGSGEGPSGNSWIGGLSQPRFRNTFGNCPSTCTPAGGSCLAANDCCSSQCASVCATACCAPVGALCSLASDCCSNNCAGAQCQACLALGQSCATSGTCCSGNCVSNTCVAPCLPHGAACASNNECCSANCIGGSCQPCVAAGGGCTSTSECCSGNCTGNICGGTCGDGTVAGFEQCDDFNTIAGDGCSPTCAAEPGHTCSGSPSVCTPCPSGFANCNGSAGDGCEVSSATDPNNCGACGNVCTIPNASAVCNGGQCQIGSCSPGYGDCNVNPVDGCEVFLGSDPNNCGACAAVCIFPNATSACNGGQCQIGSCNPGYGDCNVNPIDGCEVFLGSDPNNCGACAAVCFFPNATSACNGGQCQIGSCNPGYGDCNVNPIDGCEVFLGSAPNNCGACGNVCTIPNASAVCNGGQCQIGSCSPGYGDCNVNPIDGCEVFLGSAPNNCGACGNVCTIPNASAACNGGQCQIGSCSPGYGDCNVNPVDGCETSTTTNVNNCGGCNLVCGAVANGAPSCASGNCVAVCNAGFGNCNGNYADGCEVNLNTNGTNCGTCGHVCPPETVCSAGSCFAP